MTTTPDVIVIGAGLCGLTAARLLHRQGHTVVVLEKSRGYGGRMSRRQGESGFAEHGLPYLVAGVPQVDALIASAASVGLLQPWPGAHWQINDHDWQAEPDRRWIAPEGISGLGRWLAEGLTVHLQARAAQLNRNADFWQVTTEVGQTWTAPKVALALPAAQAQALLDTSHEPLLEPWLTALSQVKMSPCLTLIAHYLHVPATARLPSAGWSVAWPNNPTLAWAGLDSSKRLPGAEPRIVIHSGVALAQRYGQAEPNKIAALLLKAASRALDLPLTEPESWMVHRWGFAVPSVGIDAPCLAQPDLGLACGGDWAAAGMTQAQPAGVGLGSRFPARALASGEAIAQVLST